VTKVAIIHEDLTWTEGMVAFLNGYLPLYGFNVTAVIPFPIQAEAADFATYWQQIDDSGAQITVPIISAQGGILMTTQYAAVQPKTLIAGIDVMAQLDSYWDETGGACEYEVLLQSTIRTNKTGKTIAFWDAFLAQYNSEPLYTAVGSYDAMYVLRHGINEAQSLNSTEIIPFLEALTTANPLETAAGNTAFYASHDIVEGYDPVSGTIYGVTLFTQWQADGAKECVSSGGLVYPEYVVTAPLSLPSWGIND
jgi:branched-chain amino acid transport system substrate-binding protein